MGKKICQVDLNVGRATRRGHENLLLKEKSKRGKKKMEAKKVFSRKHLTLGGGPKTSCWLVRGQEWKKGGGYESSRVKK